VTFDGKNQLLFYINSVLRRRIITNSTLPFARQVIAVVVVTSAYIPQSLSSLVSLIFCAATYGPPASRAFFVFYNHHR
jgi:hypothetical protein